MLHTDSKGSKNEPGAQNTQRNDGSFRAIEVATRCTGREPQMKPPRTRRAPREDKRSNRYEILFVLHSLFLGVLGVLSGSLFLFLLDGRGDYLI